VLCTDGLWEPLATGEIAEVVQGAAAAEACRHLVALALGRGADDNLSVQVVKVVELADDSQDPSIRKNGFLRRTLNLLGNALH
jgi:serine/threonine protein phosphatase PrpC